MPSIVETTAVALRRGDHEANLAFKGIQGEVSVDLGIQTSDGVLGTDNQTTLRLHNGITKGGIPMCRADMRNITTEVLAKNRNYLGDKNLAYADLSNLEQSADASTINNLIGTLVDYGLITDTTVKNYLNDYAFLNMSNVDTVNLATSTGHIGKNLAYEDTSNINTSNLTDSILHDGTNNNKPLAYADASNISTIALATTREGYGKNLAYADLSNVSSNTWNNLFVNTYNFETKNNKDSVIPDINADIINGHYPETLAVKNYVDKAVQEGSFLTVNLNNASSWEALYSNSNQQIYDYKVSSSYIEEKGDNFIVNNEYFTGKVLAETNLLKVKVDSVDTNGVPTSISLNITEGNNEIIPESDLYIISNTNTKCYVIITSTLDTVTNLYQYTAAIDTSKTNENGFETNTLYSLSEDFNIHNLLKLIPTEIDTVGGIVNYTYNYLRSYSSIIDTRLTIINPNGTNAVVKFECINVLPNIGGAGLTKVDFSNLSGMSDSDIAAVTGKNWRINQNENIPTSSSMIDSKYDYTISTAAMVWNSLYGNNNELVHKTGDETINGIKTFTNYIVGTGLQAASADLAELYESDENYPVGTLIKFGGDKEITIADCKEVNGVISEKPALLLNKDCIGLPVALTGKVKVRVYGKVNKFDKLTNFTNGVAIKKLAEEHKTIAIALENKDYEDEGLITCVTRLSL